MSNGLCSINKEKKHPSESSSNMNEYASKNGRFHVTKKIVERFEGQ